MNCRDCCWAQGEWYLALLPSLVVLGAFLSYRSLCAKAGTRLFPKCLAVTLLGSCFPLQGVQLLDWACKHRTLSLVGQEQAELEHGELSTGPRQH